MAKAPHGVPILLNFAGIALGEGSAEMAAGQPPNAAQIVPEPPRSLHIWLKGFGYLIHTWQCTGSVPHLHWLLPLPGLTCIFCCGDAQRVYEPSLMVSAGCGHLHHLRGKTSKSTHDMRQDFALVMFPFALENKVMCSIKKVL